MSGEDLAVFMFAAALGTRASSLPRVLTVSLLLLGLTWVMLRESVPSALSEDLSDPCWIPQVE